MEIIMTRAYYESEILWLNTRESKADTVYGSIYPMNTYGIDDIVNGIVDFVAQYPFQVTMAKIIDANRASVVVQKTAHTQYQ